MVKAVHENRCQCVLHCFLFQLRGAVLAEIATLSHVYTFWAAPVINFSGLDQSGPRRTVVLMPFDVFPGQALAEVLTMLLSIWLALKNAQHANKRISYLQCSLALFIG